MLAAENLFSLLTAHANGCPLYYFLARRFDLILQEDLFGRFGVYSLAEYPLGEFELLQ